MANTLKLGAGKWATGTDTVLAFNDENNNFKPLPFSFSRASSATVVNQSGLIETVGSGTPRIDFLGNTKGALLLEPQRTNVIPRSEDIDIAWSKLNVTVANNQTVSPDGTLNAALSTVTSTNGQHASYDTLSSSVTSGQPYYISCFVKKSNTRYIRLNEGYTGDQLYYDFDNNIATLGGGASDKIVEDFGNGWFRIGFKFVPTTVNSQFALYLNDNSNNNSYAGSGEDVYIYGAQIEQGSYPTSYIPTSGSAVTRVLDSCNQTVPDGVIGQTEGVLYCEVDVKSGYDTNNLIVTLSNGTNLKQIYINRSNGKLEFFVGTNVNEMLYVSPSVLTNGVHKLALAYKQDDFAVAIDGVIAHTDNSGNVPTCNKINVGSHYNGNLPFNDRINDVKLYNTRLSNAELQALTS